MKSTAALRVVIVALAALMVSGACTRSDAEDSGGGGKRSTTTADPDLGADLVWSDDACDESAEPVKLGMIVPFAAGALSLKAQADAAEASAEAFNARGGIAGRCIEFIACDDGGDPNQAADCARDLIAEGVVATVNDNVVAGADVVLQLLHDAGIPRLDGNPLTTAFSLDNTFTLSAGGLGFTAMMLVPLAEAGVKQVAIIRADVPAAAVLRDLLKPAATALGMEIVADIPITVGTSDFSQFVLAAEDAGAQGALLAAANDEAIQVLRAAQQLDSDLYFSLSLGSLSRNDVIDFGDYADRLRFIGELPAPSSDPTPYPLLAVANRDLAASGEEVLQPDDGNTTTLRSWVLMYALVKILRDAGVTDVTPQTVTAALQAAQDVDLGDLTPPWTPNKTSDGLFERVSNPWYWTAEWNVEDQNFVMVDQLDAMELADGKKPS